MDASLDANTIAHSSNVIRPPEVNPVYTTAASSPGMESASTVGSCSLLSLPDELLLFIINGVSTSRQSLCSLARTCARLSSLSESKLYQSIFLLSGQTAALLTSSLKAKPCRASYVTSLDLRIRRDRVDGMQLLTPQLMAMDKLKTLIIESPYCNVHVWDKPDGDRWQNDVSEYVEIFRAASLLAPPQSARLLPMLQSFKLISNGLRKEFWDLGALKIIFLHPSLKSVHLASANIHVTPRQGGDDDYGPFAKSTLLRSLTLEECHVSSEGLKAILSLPKALERLTIEETNFSNADSPRNFSPVSANPKHLIAALEQQQGSLEFLRHIPTDRIPTRNLVLDTDERRSGFSNFTQLSHVEMLATSVLRFLLHHDLAPPNLKKLRLETRDRLHNVDKLLLTRPSNIAIQYAKDIPSLLDIEVLVWGISSHTSSIWPNLPQLREIHRLALELGAKAKRLSLFVHEGMDLHFVPPYLYGERGPTEVFVYDQNYTFVREDTLTTHSFKGLSADDLTEELLASFDLHSWAQLTDAFAAAHSDDEESEDGDGSSWASDAEGVAEFQDIFLTAHQEEWYDSNDHFGILQYISSEEDEDEEEEEEDGDDGGDDGGDGDGDDDNDAADPFVPSNGHI